jgi:E3 ubiquitin-protein ligase RAD18
MDIEEFHCEICKDYMNVPMALPCQHTFCSLCIRTAVKDTLRCPLCTKTFGSLNELKKNLFAERVLERFRGKIVCIEDYPETTESSKKRKLESTDSIEANSKGATKVTISIVACPICSNPVKPVNMNDHLDSMCKSFKERPNKLGKGDLEVVGCISGNSRSRNLPSANPISKKAYVGYNMYKTPKLRELLKNEGLLTTGTRALMISRHSYWIDLYNSNCDSLHPASMRELRKQMEEWENRRQSKPSLHFANKNHEVTKEDNALIQQHVDKYHDEFGKMIQQLKVRKSAKKVKESAETRKDCVTEPEKENSDNGARAVYPLAVNSENNVSKITVDCVRDDVSEYVISDVDDDFVGCIDVDHHG